MLLPSMHAPAAARGSGLAFRCIGHFATYDWSQEKARGKHSLFAVLTMETQNGPGTRGEGNATPSMAGPSRQLIGENDLSAHTTQSCSLKAMYDGVA